MATLDALITGAMPRRQRAVWAGTFWGGTDQVIVGYGDLVQSRPRGPDVDWFIVGLARQRRHLSIYVNAVENGQYVLGRYAGRLGKVRTSAARIAVARLADLDRAAFTELVATAHRVCPPDR